MIARQPFPWAKYDEVLTWCRVCGTSVLVEAGEPSGDDARCERHPGRNPCAIDGCKRSIKAEPNWSGNDLWLCSEHWPLIRPRSAERRVYHRIFRTAKRYGWTPELRARFWRIWPRLVARARSRAAGDIDVGEINRLMGWDKAA